MSCLSFRAVRTSQAGLPKDAAEQSREALQVLGTPRPGQRSLSLALRLGVAWNAARMGDLGAGIQTLRAGLLELEQMGRGHTGMASSWLNNLAVLEVQAGQPLAAVASMERVLALQGPDEVAVARSNLALSLIHIWLTVTLPDGQTVPEPEGATLSLTAALAALLASRRRKSPTPNEGR